MIVPAASRLLQANQFGEPRALQGLLSTGRLAWPFGLLLGGFFLFFHAELLSVFFGLGLVLPAFISHNALIFLHDVTKRLATGGSYAFNCSSVPPAAIIAWMPPTRRMPLRFKRMGQRVVKPPRR